MVCLVFINQELDRSRNCERVNSIELHAANVFALVMPDDAKRTLGLLNQGTRCHHF